MTPILSQEELDLREDLSVAYKATRLFDMDELVWNHLSARIPSTGEVLVTPGAMMFDEIGPMVRVLKSSTPCSHPGTHTMLTVRRTS